MDNYEIERNSTTEADMKRSIRARRLAGWKYGAISKWLRCRFVNMGLLEAHKFIEEALNGED
jgi:hypothetical protein